MNQQQNESSSLSFPAAYWSTNLLALIERASFFAVAPFAIIYLHEVLGMSPIFSTVLNGSVLWGLIYFLPVLTGILTLKFGVKRLLLVSFFILSLGYFLLGNVQRLWPRIIGAQSEKLIDYTIPVVLGILLLGIGKSLGKTGIASSIQHSSGKRSIFGLGIFYLVLNIGAISGRGISYVLRTQGLKMFPMRNGGYFLYIRPEISNIFAFTATILSLFGLLLVVFIYREPEILPVEKKDMEPNASETLPRVLSGFFLVVRNSRFLFFCFFTGIIWMLFAQIFNLFPLFLRFIDSRAPVEIYTLVTPVMVITFQILVIRLIKRVRVNTSILLSISVATLGISINIIPLLWFPDISKNILLWGLMIPVGGIFILISLALLAVAEMIFTPAMIEYISDIAPKGKEKYFHQYVNLPVFLGILLGAPLGGALFEFLIYHPMKNGTAGKPELIWVILGVTGLTAWIGFFLTNRWIAGKNRWSGNQE